MKVAVIGAGNAGCATAADMAYRGLDVTLIKTSNAMHDDNFNLLEKNGGKMILRDVQNGCMDSTDKHTDKICQLKRVTRDLSYLSDAEVVFVYVQTRYHEQLIERLSPYLQDGQILLLNPGYFSTAYVLKYCSGKDITVVEAQSSFIDGRIIAPGIFEASFRNVRNPLGIYPVSHTDYACGKLNQLGFPFTYLTNVIEAALHNPNMIVHTVGALMSVPMIDSMGKEFIMYHSAFTEHVWNVVEKLDAEKMDVLEKLGCPRVPYVEACKFRNSLDESEDAKKVFFDYAMMPNQIKGPASVEDRYITEDVPQGLVMLETLGHTLCVPTPVCTSLIEIASAMLGRDMRANGRSVERLGMKHISKVLEDAKEKNTL